MICVSLNGLEQLRVMELISYIFRQNGQANGLSSGK